MWRDVFLLKKKYFLFDHDGKDFFPSCHAFYYVFTMMEKVIHYIKKICITGKIE